MEAEPTVEIEPAETPAYLRELLPPLTRLDALLGRAVKAMMPGVDVETPPDPFRGLYISREEALAHLEREPGSPRFQADETGDSPLPEQAGEGSRLAWLQDAYSLTPFEIDVLLIALAPELDRRYERLYAYLQDHVNRRRPTVDLALDLLCQDAGERITRRANFDPDAPLIRHGLIQLHPEAGNDRPTLLAQTLVLDEQIVRFLLHQAGLDRQLTPFCRLAYSFQSSVELPLPGDAGQALPALVTSAWLEDRPLALYFQGPPEAGIQEAAAALAGVVGLPLLIVDLGRALNAGSDFDHTLQRIFRAAWLQGAVLYLDGLDALLADGQALPLKQVLAALKQDGGITILSGEKPWPLHAEGPAGVLTVRFTMPGFEQRRGIWQMHLAAAGIALKDEALEALTGRFRLWPGQIAEAVVTAGNLARWRVAAAVTAGDDTTSEFPVPTPDELFSAASAQCGQDLASLARKVEPVYTWNDIVLPEDTLAQLHEICQRVAQRRRVLGEWGFDAKLSLGKGTSALFSGPSGTGKTMAAEIIANELGVDLYKIDLAGVVSKYIGETEKNLDRIFRAAENANAILFFDEADALFGKRSEVRDSHDRYANIEISYLLQKMEEYDGLAILATNLRLHLDQAFTRRLAFTVHFPFPDEEARRLIWQGIWPAEAPLSESVDLDLLAARFKLSGGGIKNNALAGAFLAAGDDGEVTMAHLLQATRREYQKMGKQLTAADLATPGANGQS